MAHYLLNRPKEERERERGRGSEEEEEEEAFCMKNVSQDTLI